MSRLACMIVMVSLVAACGKKEKPAPPPPLVGIVRPVSAEVSNWDEVVGRFVSIDAVEVRPRVSGYVTRIGFRDGEDVRALTAYAAEGDHNAARRRARARQQRAFDIATASARLGATTPLDLLDRSVSLFNVLGGGWQPAPA